MKNVFAIIKNVNYENCLRNTDTPRRQLVISDNYTLDKNLARVVLFLSCIMMVVRTLRPLQSLALKSYRGLYTYIVYVWYEHCCHRSSSFPQTFSRLAPTDHCRTKWAFVIRGSIDLFIHPSLYTVTQSPAWHQLFASGSDRCLAIHPFTHACIHDPCIIPFHSHPSIYPSVRQPIRPSNNQSNQPSIDASVCPPFRPSILPSNNPIIQQSIQLTIHFNLSAGTLTAPEHWEV